MDLTPCCPLGCGLPVRSRGGGTGGPGRDGPHLRLLPCPQPGRLLPGALHPGWLGCVGWLGLGPSCAGFAVFCAVLHRTSTVYVSSLLNLVPGGTALASVPILGEPLTLRVAIGLVIALAGMYVGVVLPGRREHPPRPVQPEPVPAVAAGRQLPATSSAGR